MHLGTAHANESNGLKEKELTIVLIADIRAEKTRGKKKVNHRKQIACN